MTRQQIRSPRFALTLIAAMLSFAGAAQAGPPLICHTIEIGQAKSLRRAALRGDDPLMKIPPTLKTLSRPPNEHRTHTKKAIAGAKTDSLLAQNLSARFIGPQTETMSQLFVKN